MKGLLQDVRYAWRGLRKRPGFALLTILILALGSGATTIIFTIISGVLLKPLAYQPIGGVSHIPTSSIAGASGVRLRVLLHGPTAEEP